MNKEVMFSSKSEEWETPKNLFDELNAIYHFDIDVCASQENAKCPFYFDKNADGLKQDWDGHRCWCNPPYGKEISKFVRKAYLSKALTVMLIPARTDTRWFHDFIYEKPNVKTIFLKGRLHFSNAKNSAPFPSMICVFDNLRR